MGNIVNLKVESSMNRNSMVTFKVINPTAEQQAVLVEGKDIVVPLFEGIVFSGEVKQVAKKQMTPDGVAKHMYVWEVEAVSDEVKLANQIIPSDVANTYLTKTPGELLKMYLGDDWVGDISTSGAPFGYTSLPVDKDTIVSDMISQTDYDFRTRRKYERFVIEEYTRGVGSFTGQVIIKLLGADHADNTLIGKTVMFVDGPGAYLTTGTIFINGATFTDANGVHSVIGIENVANINLPKVGNRLIIIEQPVVDFKPVMGEGAPVRSYTINETLFDFDAIDDVSSQYTKVVCTGRSHTGRPISSTLAAIYPSSGLHSCTVTTYRGDSTLAAQANAGDSAFYVRGHQFKPAVDEVVEIFGTSKTGTITVASYVNLYDQNKTPITRVNLRSGYTLQSTWEMGSPVCYYQSKMYVEDPSVIPGNVAVVGEEYVIFTGGVGEDSNGKYFATVHRGQTHAGGVPTYDHPIGVLVRSPSYSEAAPYYQSPFALHGELVNVVASSADCSKGDLDRLCSTLLPQGANVTNTGEGSVPLNHFWKVDGKTSPGYVPLEVGDMISVMRDGVSTGNYVLLSFKIDFDKMRVAVRLGDKEEHIVFKLQNLYSTIARNLS